METRKLKIAFILDSLLCCGGNKVALEHALYLQELHHNVTILVLNDGESSDWFIGDKLLRFKRLINCDELSSYDVAIAIYFTGALFLLACDTTAAKLWFVQGDDRRSVGDSEKNIINLLYASKALTIFTEAYWIQKMFFNEFGHYVEVIPNGVNLNIYYPERGFYWTEESPLIICEGYAGAEVKGIDLAAKALEDLEVSKWLITSQITELPKFTNVFDKIIVRPSAHDMRRLLSDATIFLKTSRFEGSPLPHLEAMACGTCLVATRCSGVSEYCQHMYNAWLIPNQNISEIRRGVEFLLEHRDIIDGLSERARQFARENLEWGKSICKLEKLLISQEGSPRKQLDQSAILAINSIRNDPNFKAFPWHQALLKKFLGSGKQLLPPEPSHQEIVWIRDSVLTLTLGTCQIVRSVRAEVMCSKNFLSGIKVKIGAHGRAVEGIMYMTLGLRGQTIRCSSVNMGEVFDNSWIEFLFAPIPESYGEKFSLKLMLTMNSDSSPVSLYTYERNSTKFLERVLNKINTQIPLYSRSVSYICGYLSS